MTAQRASGLALADVHIRPLDGSSDLASAAAMCVAACVHDTQHTAMLTGLLRAPRQALVATAHSTIVGLAIASTGPAPGTPPNPTNLALPLRAHAGFLDLLAVAPALQGRGVGTRLLTQLESKLTAFGCLSVHVAGNPPFYAWPGVDARYTRAVAMLETNGYRRSGVEMTMSVALTEGPLGTRCDEERLRQSGVTFRSAQLQEADALRAGLSRWKGQWLDELDAALACGDGGVEVAIDDTGYVGFCAYGVNRPGEVGPLGTDPRWRGQGIGTTLIRRALQVVADQGHQVGELPWAGPLSLFARTLDATVTRVFITYSKTLE